MADHRLHIKLTAKNITGKAFRAVNRSVISLTSSVFSLQTAFVGLGGGLVAKSLFDAGVQAQGLDRAFVAITGSTEKAKKEFNFLREITNKLGLEFYSSADAFKGIAAAAMGTKLEGKAVRQIFLGVSEACSAMSLPTNAATGALYALQQMISKGRVSSEELRQQLGERLPGAMQIAAKSMGLTDNAFEKLVETGKITAEEFLPRFSWFLRERFSDSAKAAASDAVKSAARFKTAWMDLKVEIAETGFMDVAKETLDKLIKSMKDPVNKEALKNIGKLMTKIGESIVANLIPGLEKALDLLNDLTNIIKNIPAKGITAFFGASIGAIMGAPFGPLGAGIGMAIGAMGGEAIGRAYFSDAKAELRKEIERTKKLIKQQQAAKQDWRGSVSSFFGQSDIYDKEIVKYKKKLQELNKQLKESQEEQLKISKSSEETKKSDKKGKSNDARNKPEEISTVANSIADMQKAMTDAYDLAEKKTAAYQIQIRKKWLENLDEFKMTENEKIVYAGKVTDEIKALEEKTYKEQIDLLKSFQSEYDHIADDALAREIKRINEKTSKLKAAAAIMHKNNKQMLDKTYGEIEAWHKKQIEQAKERSKSEQEYQRQTDIEKLKSTEDWVNGVKASLMELNDNFRTQAQQWSDIVTEAAYSMQQSMSNFFFDAMTGKLKTLKDYFISFYHSIVRMLSDIAAENIVRGLQGFISPIGKKLKVSTQPIQPYTFSEAQVYYKVPTRAFESIGAEMMKPSLFRNTGYREPDYSYSILSRKKYLFGEAGPKLGTPQRKIRTEGDSETQGNVYVTNHNYVQAVDAKSFADMIEHNPGSIVTVVERAMRGNTSLRHTMKRTI